MNIIPVISRTLCLQSQYVSKLEKRDLQKKISKSEKQCTHISWCISEAIKAI